MTYLTSSVRCHSLKRRNIMKRIGLRGSLGASAAAALLVLTSCGGGDDAADEGTDEATQNGELTEISVGVIPIVDVAPIYLGVEEGILEENGLDGELNLAQGGAAIIHAVAAGDFGLGLSKHNSLLS